MARYRGGRKTSGRVKIVKTKGGHAKAVRLRKRKTRKRK